MIVKLGDNRPPCPFVWRENLFLESPVLSKVDAPNAGANAIAANKMTPVELRASFSLASIFALRMLGLFLILPVFVIEAAKYPGGDDPALIGLTMGIYGLTQAMLQFLYGMASDRFGRKPVVIFGLLLFAVGSFVAALAPSLAWLGASAGKKLPTAHRSEEH